MDIVTASLSEAQFDTNNNGQNQKVFTSLIDLLTMKRNGSEEGRGAVGMTENRGSGHVSPSKDIFSVRIP